MLNRFSALRWLLPMLVITSIYRCASPEQDGPQLLRWDFHNSDTRVYRFSQTTESSSSTNLPLQDSADLVEDRAIYRSVVNGDLVITSHGDGTAGFSLEDIAMNVFRIDELSGVVLDSMEEVVEPMVLENIGENGQALVSNELSSQFFDYLFPLPSDTLAPGESEEKELLVPVNSIGFMIMVGGKSTTTFKEVTRHKGRLCAVIELDLLLDQLDTTQTAGTDLQYSRSGHSTFYFDLKEREFVSGNVRMINTLAMDGGPAFGNMNLRSEDAFYLELSE